MPIIVPKVRSLYKFFGRTCYPFSTLINKMLFPVVWESSEIPCQKSKWRRSGKELEHEAFFIK